MPDDGAVQAGGSERAADDPAARIVARAGPCVIAGTTAYALYDGLRPVVAATAYLRSRLHDDNDARHTLRRRAYHLTVFFRFLAAQERTFWDIGPDRLELVRWYRRELLRRTRVPRGEPDRLALSSARVYLLAVKDLFVYWHGTVEPTAVPAWAGASREGRGGGMIPASAPRARAARSAFRIPQGFRPRTLRGLPTDLYEETWAALEEVPPLLVPSFVRTRGEREGEAAGAVPSALALDVARMRYYRDKAIWALLHAAGTRIGELVRVRAVDVQHRPAPGTPRGAGAESDWYLDLQRRDEDAFLGELKTGPALIYVGHEARLMTHILEWRRRGMPLAAKIRARSGRPEHPMLFSSSHGGPLRQGTVRRLLARLDRVCGLAARGYPCTPHTARHTTASFMRTAGVPAAFIQRWLRHLNAATTDVYGSVLDPEYRRAIDDFHRSTERAAAERLLAAPSVAGRLAGGAA